MTESELKEIEGYLEKIQSVGINRAGITPYHILVCTSNLIKELRKAREKIKELEEYEWMYKDLCK